jgi:hypothetical protein
MLGVEATPRSSLNPTDTGLGATAPREPTGDRANRDASPKLTFAARAREEPRCPRLAAAIPTSLINPTDA